MILPKSANTFWPALVLTAKPRKSRSEVWVFRSKNAVSFMFWLLCVAFTMHSSQSCVWAQSASPYNDPNVIILLADDLGYGDLGCFGHPTIKTPNLDRLAKDGLRLTSFYSAAPVCSPSRAGLLTGRVPQRDGINDWIKENSSVFLPTETPTIATTLRLFGYQTAMFGKWHLNGKLTKTGKDDQASPSEHGFAYWFATQNNALPTHENPVNFLRNGQPVGKLKGNSSTLIVNEALDWLSKRDKKKPFFLYVPFHAPHERIATDSQYVKAYESATGGNAEQAQYFGNVTQLDAEIGRLLERLDDLNLRDNTLVLFTSDNGPETLKRYVGAERSYGTPGEIGKAKLRGMKLHLYEGGIRVPAIVRWPEFTKAGRESDAVTCGLDVMPTLLETLGISLERDDRVDGVSFAKLLVSNSWERKKAIYWQYDNAISANEKRATPKFALRDGDYKMLTDAEFKTVELYNIRTDPGETTDISAKEVKRVRPMLERARLIRQQILIREK
jgi:arylsulfatase A